MTMCKTSKKALAFFLAFCLLVAAMIGMASYLTAGATSASFEVIETYGDAGSLKVQVGSELNNYDKEFIVMKENIPAATIADADGIFFRLKANNSAGLRFDVSLASSDPVYGTNTWETQSSQVYVPLNGAAVQGALPANFDGYVFLYTPWGAAWPGYAQGLKDGGCAASILAYEAANSTLQIDNVGYFSFPEYIPQSYDGLAADIWAACPDDFGEEKTPDTFEVIETYGDAGSLKVQVGSELNNYDKEFIVMKENIPAATIADADGIFFRLKANNSAGLRFDVSFASGDLLYGTNTWETQGSQVYVPLNGAAVQGALPANFDGYVFLYTPWGAAWPDYAQGLKDGGCTASILAYEATNSTLQIDNVGYFSFPEYIPQSYDGLAADIWAACPDDFGEGSGGEGGNMPGGDGNDTPPVSTPAFEVIQSFNTAEDYAKASVNSGFLANGGVPIGTIAHMTDQNVMCGEGALSMEVGRYPISGYTAIQLLEEMPAATIQNAQGVFFRLKANNIGGAYFRIAFTDGAIEWGVSAFDLASSIQWVSKDGTAGHGGLPANFDGYVFLYTPWADAWPNYAAGIQSGGEAMNLMIYGSDEYGFDNATLWLDNVGYFAYPASEEDYPALAEAVWQAYPENVYGELPKNDLVVEEEDVPDIELSDDAFIVFQAYETAEDYAQAGVATKFQTNNYSVAICTPSHRRSVDALAGAGSLRIIVDSLPLNYEFAAATLATLPPASIENLGGIFFRLKATNAEGAYVRLALTDKMIDWNNNTFPFDSFTTYAVDMRGNVYTGGLPANFDGYIFPTINFDSVNETYLKLLYKGNCPLNLMMYGGESCFSGATLQIDNVGYFQAQSSEAGYAALAKAIAEKYPDNNYVPKAVRLYLENATDPSLEALVLAGLRSKLTARVNEDVSARAVVWSVISGEAEIESLDSGTEGYINGSLNHSCLIDFKDSGTVVIRAALKHQPDEYEDFTYTVLPNPVALDNLINTLKNATGSFDEADYAALQEAIAEAEKVLNDENATQKDYLSQMEKLEALGYKMGVLKVTETGKTIRLSGVLMDDNGLVMTGCSVSLDGETKPARYAFTNVGMGTHDLVVLDSAGDAIALYTFTLMVGDKVSVNDTVLYVAEDTASVQLSFEIADGELTILQYSEDGHVIGSTDADVDIESLPDGENSPATGVKSGLVAVVALIFLCGATILVSKKRSGRNENHNA